MSSSLPANTRIGTGKEVKALTEAGRLLLKSLASSTAPT